MLARLHARDECQRLPAVEHALTVDVSQDIVGAQAGGFRRAFEAKGRMASYLEPIPVYVIMIGTRAALKGAAAALAGLIAAT